MTQLLFLVTFFPCIKRGTTNVKSLPIVWNSQNTTMTKLFHSLLTLIASGIDRELAKYVEFLKEENKIVRARILGQVPALISPVSGLAGPISLSVTNPDPTAPMAITNFQVFVSQSPSLENNVLGFADFSKSPFTGSAVSGIPSSFTLDASDPTVIFSQASYPALMTDPNTLVFIEGTINGSSMFRYEVSAVPEPSTISMVGTGLAAAFALRRRPQATKSRRRSGPGA